MSGGDSFWSELHRSDPWISAITPERIEAALTDFPLPLADGWDWKRLTRAIQDTAIFASGKAPQGDAAAIDELKKLAKKAMELHQAIARMGKTAKNAAYWEVVQHLKDRRNADCIESDANYDFEPLMLCPLETIANILARAASEMGTQPKQTPRWREKHDQQLRTDFAIALTLAFQNAFNTPARANNWHASYGDEHPWPEFYRRIYVELFPGAQGLNLTEILQKAARQLPDVEAEIRGLGG